MPNPRFQKRRKKNYSPHTVQHDLEFAEDFFTEGSLDFRHMQPPPRAKDFEEIEY